jgi:hypothetical protein
MCDLSWLRSMKSVRTLIPARIQMLAKRLRNGFLYSKTSCKRLFVLMRRRVDPNWFARLEQEMEFRSHWVSTTDIRLISGEQLGHKCIGEVRDGDWDLQAQPFEELDFYQAFVAVSGDGCIWRETPFFQRVVSEINAGLLKWGCRTEDEFVARLQYLEEVYREMGRLGYVPNHNQDQVSVNIGRHGDLLFNDGRHRLTFAKLLGIPRLPITIVARHPQWVKFKAEILEYARDSSGGKVYAPLLHPDLEWIPAHHGYLRFELIRRALGMSSGTMLDIGCNWGYFCHQFEEIGFDCTGVELSPRDFYFLQKLKRAANRRFRIVNESIVDFLAKESRQYDVVLALAIFHHFIKSKEGYEQLRALLSGLHVRELYFLPGRSSEPQMQNAYWNPSEEAFVAFVLEHTGLTHAVCLGFAEDGRHLYKLE